MLTLILPPMAAVLAEIAVEQDHPRHVWASVILVLENCRRLVEAAVVDEDEGKGVVWQGVDDGARPLVELGQDGFFVVTGDEDVDLLHRLSPPAAAWFRRTV